MRGVNLLLFERDDAWMRRVMLGGRWGVALGELPSGVLGQSTSNIMVCCVFVLFLYRLLCGCDLQIRFVDPIDLSMDVFVFLVCHRF